MTELRDIKGIGPVTEKKLHAIGISKPHDMLAYYPSRYKENRLDNEKPWVLQETLMLLCEVAADPRLFFIRKNLTKMTIKTNIDGQPVDVHIFNRHFLKKMLRPKTKIVVTGSFKDNHRHFTASEIILHKNFKAGIEPIYSVGDLSATAFHKWILRVLDDDAAPPQDRLPETLLAKHGLPPLKETYRKIHAPKNKRDVAVAQTRIKYEEMLMFTLRLHAQRIQTEKIKVPRKGYDIGKVRSFIEKLPFELTDDQKQATNDIFRDLKKNRPMNRLLQGDVGSGKTVCAMLAAYATMTAGEQIAFMAPTEILARQHHETFKKFLMPLGVELRFLSASTPSEERKLITADLQTGKVDIIIGTHALLSEDVMFSHMGFAIIDEQHRFGVAQRGKLREKGVHPDVLYLSATPIPRTLAIGLLGNIRVSSIMQLPQGRKPVRSFLVGYDAMDEVFSVMEKELSKNRQVFFVVPLIEESDAMNHMSIDAFEDVLNEHIPEGTSYAVLHGRMPDDEKAAVMARFKANEVSVLLSTSVIEVGMDVGNATMMVIISADRFGLSQLHQMRGRVGRSGYPSKAYFVADDPEKARERLHVLIETSDGFKISEADLRMRGPGEVFGLHQAGMPRFMMANLLDDTALFDQAQNDAVDVFSSEEHKAKVLKKQAMKHADGFHLD